MKDQDDQILNILIGCQKHLRESQKSLYKAFYAYGMSICIRYSENRDEAAEILNDGFMKIFQNIKKFDISKPFQPWLRKILVNTAINHYRQKLRTIQAEEIERARHQGEVENILSGISYQEIIGMLRKLPPAYRTVFNLYAIEGYRHEEIAEQLGITVGTSKSNLFKAKELLKKILSNFFEVDYADKK